MPSTSENSGWAYCALESLGLPLFYSCDESKGVSCLEGYESNNLHEQYTDEEIIKLLSNDCFIDSKVAKHFIDRGFGKYLGVDVIERDATPLKGEVCVGETTPMAVQAQSKKLVVNNENTIVSSYA